MKLRKILAAALAAVLAASSLAGCGGSNGDTIKLGGLAPMSGDVSQYGVPAMNGAKLAIKEMNEKGGVLGKQVEFLVEDEEGDATKAINAYNKLVGKKVAGIIGDITSKPCISVAQKSVADNMPLVTPTATAAEVTSYGGNIFRACFLDPFQGETMAKYAANEMKVKKAAVLYDSSDDYSIGCAEIFTETLKNLNVEVVASESFGKGDTDFKAQLTKLMGLAPEAVYVPAYYNTDAMICTQAKEIGFETTFLGVDGWDGVVNSLSEDNRTAADGAYFTNHYYTGDDTPVVKNFFENYRAEYNSEPNSFAALGYDAAMILMQAIERAGSTDKAAVIEELGKTQYEGVTGSISYAGSGDPIKGLCIITIENGEYKLVTKYVPE